MDETETTITPIPPAKRRPGRPAKPKVKKMHPVATERVEPKIRKNARISSMVELDTTDGPIQNEGEDEVAYLERVLAWKKEEVKKAQDAKMAADRSMADHNGRLVTHPKQGPWNVAEAREVYVNTVSHMGMRVRLCLGNLPEIEILRGRRVIIPYDAFTVLQDTITKKEFHDMNTNPPTRLSGDNGIESTNYPFQDYGPKTWDEYIAFKEQEMKKEYSPSTNKAS